MYRYAWVIKLFHWIGCLVFIGYEVESVYHFIIGSHYYVGNIDFTPIRMAGKAFIILFAFLLYPLLNYQNPSTTQERKKPGSYLLAVVTTLCFSSISFSGFFFPPLFYACLLIFYFMIIIPMIFSFPFSVFCFPAFN